MPLVEGIDTKAAIGSPIEIAPRVRGGTRGKRTGGMIITIEILEIKIIDINVIPNEIHLGIFKKFLIFPVMVQSAIAIIIEAKNSIIISFKPHKINKEIIKAVIDRKLVCFNLNN